MSEGDDDIADYRLRDDNYPDPDESRTIPVRVETTFHDHLLDQLGMLSLDDRRAVLQNRSLAVLMMMVTSRREVSAIVDDLSFSTECTNRRRGDQGPDQTDPAI